MLVLRNFTFKIIKVTWSPCRIQETRKGPLVQGSEAERGNNGDAGLGGERDGRMW